MKKPKAWKVAAAMLALGLALYLALQFAGEGEFRCSSSSDCVLSGNHPSGPAVCVNKNWQAEWDRSPESEGKMWQCTEMVCERTYPENCGYVESSCDCANNRCERADISKYGYRWEC